MEAALSAQEAVGEVIVLGTTRVGFPAEVGFSLSQKDLEDLLSHALLLVRGGEAGIPVVASGSEVER